MHICEDFSIPKTIPKYPTHGKRKLIRILSEHLYLRNLLTHTVNNLLQTHNDVKSIQFSVVKQKFNIIHIICENFKAIP